MRLLMAQLKRQVRERREYLYKKAIEDKESAIYERKRRLKEYLDGGDVWACLM